MAQEPQLSKLCKDTNEDHCAKMFVCEELSDTNWRDMMKARKRSRRIDSDFINSVKYKPSLEGNQMSPLKTF